MIDWQAAHFDPIYADHGVPATLESAAGDSASIVAVDKTAGLPITDARTMVDTIRPVARIRARELEATGIAVTDLTEGHLTLNDQTWRILSYRPRPSPLGEADGEIDLILLNEPS